MKDKILAMMSKIFPKKIKMIFTCHYFSFTPTFPHSPHVTKGKTLFGRAEKIKYVFARTDGQKNLPGRAHFHFFFTFKTIIHGGPGHITCEYLIGKKSRQKVTKILNPD